MKSNAFNRQGERVEQLSLFENNGYLFQYLTDGNGNITNYTPNPNLTLLPVETNRIYEIKKIKIIASYIQNLSQVTEYHYLNYEQFAIILNIAFYLGSSTSVFNKKLIQKIYASLNNGELVYLLKESFVFNTSNSDDTNIIISIDPSNSILKLILGTAGVYRCFGDIILEGVSYQINPNRSDLQINETQGEIPKVPSINY